MTDKEIGDFAGDRNWHKTNFKTKLIKKNSKELEGSTNADFYVDKSTKEVLLQGNKSKAWVRTGEHYIP